MDEQGHSAQQIGRFVGKDHANVSCFLRTAKSTLNMSDLTRQSRSRMLSLSDERVLKHLIV